MHRMDRSILYRRSLDSSNGNYCRRDKRYNSQRKTITSHVHGMQIKLFDPDKIVLMPCGFDLNRTLREARILDKYDGWKSLQAVQNKEVYMVNANAYFSKPGPRTIVGLEILAKIINPKLSISLCTFKFILH